MKMLDLTDKKFARLTAIRRVENAPGYGQARWLFRCDCGTEKVLFGYSVVHGKVLSCGCWRAENKTRLRHGMAGTPIFISWAAMRQRCTNEKAKAFPAYGGRGITICPEWDTFERFFADMGERPAGTSLDRIDNEKGYSPENCRWASDLQQVRNRKTTIFYEFEGERHSLQEWAERKAIPYSTIWQRYKIGKRGAALFVPPMMGGVRVKGQTKTS